MRNPIFHAETKFLDHIDGSQIRYVSGDKTQFLNSGVKIMRLETVQPLVEVTTAAGFTLTMAPESAFALEKNQSGHLIRFTPIDHPYGDDAAPIDWQAPLDDVSQRVYALAGLIMGGGSHSFVRQRASYIQVSDLDSALAIKSFLDRIAEKYHADGMIHGHAKLVTLSQSPEGDHVVRARVLTLLVGSMLTEHLHKPTFDLGLVEKNLLRAFFKGVFMACKRHNDAVIIRHRHAGVVRTLAEHLSYRFGVTSTISIHPMEPLVQRSLFQPEVHHLRLSSEQLNRAALAGLVHGGGQDFDVQQFTTDSIAKITPLKERLDSVIILPGQGPLPILTANGFVFHPEFTIPTGITEIASHPALLEDSSDPTRF